MVCENRPYTCEYYLNKNTPITLFLHFTFRVNLTIKLEFSDSFDDSTNIFTEIRLVQWSFYNATR
jgi:hypothetical protein